MSSVDRMELMQTFVRIVDGGSLSAAAGLLGWSIGPRFFALFLFAAFVAAGPPMPKLFIFGLGYSAKRIAQRAQSLFDIMFSDMDRSLREMGVSDISIGKRVKHMVKAFYGRAVAYDEGLTGPDTVLRDALERNLFGTVQPSQNQLAAMAEYLRYQADNLAKASDQDTLAGKLKFFAWRGKGVDL